MYLYTKSCLDTFKFTQTFDIYLWTEVVEKDNVKLLTCGLSIVYDLNTYRYVLKITHRKIEHDKFLIRPYVSSGVGIKPALATI
jgi:hypothetical protein